MDRIYKTAEVCKWFDVPRTTLFRWEEENRIPKTERDAKNQRIYRRWHLERISEIVRENLHDETVNYAKQDSLCMSLDTQERLYRTEFFSGRDRDSLDGLKQLRALARRKQLSENTIEVLVDEALNRPAGDNIRLRIWDLLHIQDLRAAQN